jgi:hypothetical protein
MTVTQLEEALYQLREHAARLVNDVELAANEAETLVTQLEKILLSHYAA